MKKNPRQFAKSAESAKSAGDFLACELARLEQSLRQMRRALVAVLLLCFSCKGNERERTQSSWACYRHFAFSNQHFLLEKIFVLIPHFKLPKIIYNSLFTHYNFSYGRLINRRGI